MQKLDYQLSKQAYYFKIYQISYSYTNTFRPGQDVKLHPRMAGEFEELVATVGKNRLRY